ncbi:hypothetical protein QQS21_008314 [Conoideocrella luteorostrata]|uniref:Mid2 domain-containing protein n=1 Tax=Conoideocrella luteorostrata TaxID=1105319 RepID=A0AAJ0CK05_9HYPO|nr:hypothetical protein QQS21_008314 [Conoideocrella luteorostrata]
MPVSRGHFMYQQHHRAAAHLPLRERRRNMLRGILCILLSIPSALALAEFFVPGPPPYPRWKVGDVHKIRYRTTYTKYTIALWQQFDGAAKLGPILFQTTNGPDQDFDWLVQSYSLDLNISDKFFLWLFEGDPSVQGNTSIKNSQSSGFFFISPGLASTSSSASPTSSSSAIPSSSLTVPTGQATTSGDPTKPTSDVSQNSSSELSPGAKAGIGVGAGVAGLAILFGILLFVKYRPKKKKEAAELQSNNYYFNPGGAGSSDMSKMVHPSATTAHQPPSELLGSHGTPRAAELG